MSDQDFHQSLPEKPEFTITPLNAEAIRAKASYQERVVEVDGIGPVLMRTPKAGEIQRIAEACMRPDGSVDEAEMTVRVIIAAVPTLTEADADWLRDASGLAVDALGRGLKGLGLQVEEVKALAGQFRAAPGADVRVDPEPEAGDASEPDAG